MKTVLLCGSDGYIGFPLSLRLLENGYKVIGVDNLCRRRNVKKMNSTSATNILEPRERADKLRQIGDYNFYNIDVSMLSKPDIKTIIEKEKPDIIINLAHNPSAAFSQKDHNTSNWTIINNVIGTNNLLWYMREIVPDCHYITIGTMGEYNHGLNIDIEEGYFRFTHHGRLSEECIFPRAGNSQYHTTKIMNTYLIDYLTRTWNIRCTDVMQGVVYGLYTDECAKYNLITRFDTDECFGTVFNRLCTQALLDIPLTVFGEGEHKRGFLSLNDSVQALMIAVENPGQPGKVQTWNQLSYWYSMNEIANMVNQFHALNLKIDHIPTPRTERTVDHYYNICTNNLLQLGYVPTRTLVDEIEYVTNILNTHLTEEKKDVLRNVVMPTVKWR